MDMNLKQRYISSIKGLDVSLSEVPKDIFQQLEKEALRTIVAAISLKDFHTNGHSEGMEKMAIALCSSKSFIENFGYLRQNQKEKLELLCKYHDIGKLTIAESILGKEGPLTKEEFDVIKTHPRMGFWIAKQIPSIKPIAKYILFHHERWDGTGYHGLLGTQTPLLARIVALVDAYDAMTCDRCYRKALTEREAKMEIKKCAGSQFDPTLSEILLGII